MERDVKLLVLKVSQCSNGGLKRTNTLVDRSRLMPVLWTVSPISETQVALGQNNLISGSTDPHGCM